MGRSVGPVGKTTAVIAASGGLLAAFAGPGAAGTHGSAALIDQGSLVSQGSAQKADEASQAASSEGVVAAPKADANVAVTAKGMLGYTAVAKPKPKPARAATPAPTAPRATRSTAATRSSSTSNTSKKKSTSKAPSRSIAPASSGVLGVAASLTGIPYRYGGTTPSGFDCSGFTSYVFRKVGKSLPRTAEQQRRAATRVSNPQPGDLVFFGAPAWHVGIYAGNGKMYDSPRSGKFSSLRKIFSGSVTYGRP